jgi:hypothetical protein
MKSKKLKSLVKKAREELSWLTLEEVQPTGPLHIFSDPVARTHTIFRPAPLPDDDGGPDKDLHYLHELGHALLCERVHPFFSNSFPISGLSKDQVPAVSPVLSTASDWFVGHWMTEFCPDAAIAELKKEFGATARMMENKETPSLDKFFVAVLIIAQSVKYLDEQVACSGILDEAVKAFLAVPPENPSVGKIEDLINSLLALGTPYQCRHLTSQGQDVLHFYRVSE